MISRSFIQRSLRFDGVDDYIATQLVGFPGGSPRYGWTTAIWVDIGSDGRFYVDCRGPEGLGQYSLTLYAGGGVVQPPNPYYPGFCVERDNVWRNVYAPVDLRNMGAVFLAGVFIPENYNPAKPEDNLRIYVNGVDYATKHTIQNGSGIGLDQTWSNQAWYINRHRAWNVYGKCTVHEIRLYRRALSRAEISWLYNNGRGRAYDAGISEGLILCLLPSRWRGSSWVRDVSGSGNHGTIYGAVRVRREI